MPEMRNAALGNLPAAQAAELALLVDLEARWENLRKTPAPDAAAATLDLVDRQKSYETFRVKLVAYNDRHTPAHVPELLLNTPLRLGAWCRRIARPLPASGARPSRPPPGAPAGESLPGAPIEWASV